MSARLDPHNGLAAGIGTENGIRCEGHIVFLIGKTFKMLEEHLTMLGDGQAAARNAQVFNKMLHQVN